MLILYEHPLSPYAQKNKIALLEKGVEFEARLPAAVGTGSRADAGFVDASPRLEVPALVDGDVSVFDSTVILEYLEDRFPQPSLLPRSPADRARVRMIEEVMDTHYEPINWALSEVRNFHRADGELAQVLETRAAEETERFFGWLEDQLGEREWFNGERFGWGDLSIVPYLNGSAGFGLRPEAGSRLAAWRERAGKRESVMRVTREAVAAAGAMAGVAELVEKRLFRRQYRDHRLEWMIRSGGLDVVVAGIRNDNIRFGGFLSRPGAPKSP